MRLFSVIFILFSATIASAGDRYYRSGGYCYSYTPNYSYYTPSYYTPNYYYQPTYTVPTPTYVPTQTVINNNTDWRTQVLKYKEKVDDLTAFQQTMSALGVRTDQQYLAPQAYLGGQTAYGYSFNTTKDIYGSLDLNILFQQASQANKSALQLGGESNNGFQSLVGQVSNNQLEFAKETAKIEEVRAKTLGVATALIAANAQPSSKITASGNLLVPNGQNLVQNNQVAQNGNFQNILNARCATCHTGPQAKSSLDVTKWGSLTEAQREECRDRIISTDLKRHMPRDEKTQQPIQLPGVEIKQFFIN